MKKLLIAVLFLGASSVHAFELPDFVKSTLLDHVSAVTQVGDGETRGAVMDSVVMIGKHKGESILDLQVGFAGNFNPDADQPGFGNFVAGGFLKANSLLDFVKVPDHWKFVKSIEHGPFIQYDFREEKEFYGYQFAIPFSLNPKQ